MAAVGLVEQLVCLTPALQHVGSLCPGLKGVLEGMRAVRTVLALPTRPLWSGLQSHCTAFAGKSCLTLVSPLSGSLW